MASRNGEDVDKTMADFGLIAAEIAALEGNVRFTTLAGSELTVSADRRRCPLSHDGPCHCWRFRGVGTWPSCGSSEEAGTG